MMKHIYTILSLLLLQYLSFGQDTAKLIVPKNQFYLQTGFCYKNFLGSKYIAPIPTNYPYYEPFEKHQYDRFTKIPTIGFSAGILFTHNYNKRWGITTGLLYFLRKDVFQNNQDAVIKYGNISTANYRNIHNTIEYNYSNNNIEIPIMLKYSINKLDISFGAYIPIVSYKIVAYTYVFNQNPHTYPIRWAVANKTVSGFDIPIKFQKNGKVWQLHNTGKGYSGYDILLKIFPTIQVSYETKIRNIKFKPYLALYYALFNQNDIYAQLGINFPLAVNQIDKPK